MYDDVKRDFRKSCVNGNLYLPLEPSKWWFFCL